MKNFIDNMICGLKEDIKYAENYIKVLEEGKFAEENKDNEMIDGKYCWQTFGSIEHCKECNILCNGNIDYYENYDFMAEEHNNDFCEWKWGIDFAQVQCKGDRILFGSRRLFTYCPYCGKEIKVVE